MPDDLMGLVQRYKRRAELAERLANLIGNDLELAAEAHQMLAELLAAARSQRQEPVTTAPSPEGHDTVFGRVVRYFVSHNNQPVRLKELAKGAGVNSGTLGHIVYRAHADQFVSDKLRHEGHRATYWRLKPDVYEKARNN